MPGAITLDMSVGDVSQTAPIGSTKNTKERTMSVLPTKTRDNLPSSAFALPAQRKYPIHDKAHAENAMARLEQNKSSLSPSEYASAKAKINAAEKRFGVKAARKRGGPKKGLHMRVDTKLGTINVHHAMNAVGGQLVEFPGLMELDATLLSSTSEKRVWIQVAKCGTFRGHPSGPFQLTPTEFGQIVQNFRLSGSQPLPIDFEHASESPPTSGSTPVVGAPAQGWMVDLDNRGNGGLWACVEWLEPARTYIKAGNYKFFSPAIHFKSKDRVSGAPIGARLSSGALTNQPFLEGMLPLVAKDYDATAMAASAEPAPQAHTAPGVLAGAYCYSSAEYMPQFKKALGMHELTSATECMDKLCSLADMHGMGGGADVHGVPVMGYVNALRDTLRVPMTSTVEEIFDTVKAMIQAAIEEHEAEYHEPPPSAPDASMSDDDDTDVAMGAGNYDDENNSSGSTMTARSNVEVGSMDPKELVLQLNATKANEAALSLQLKDANAQIAALTAKVGAATTKLVEFEEGKLKEEVSTAFETYKDAKKLSDHDKEGMMVVLKAQPETFRKMYPVVAQNERHLLRSVAGNRDPGTTRTPSRTPDPDVDGNDVLDGPPNVVTLTHKILASNKGMSFEEAQNRAAKALKIGMTPARR